MATIPAPATNPRGRSARAFEAVATRWTRAGETSQKPFAKHPWTFEVALFAFALIVYQASRALVIGQPLHGLRERHRDHQLGEELRALRGDEHPGAGC